MVFTDCKGQLIRDGDLEITVVDGDENEAPLLNIDNNNDNINDQQYQEEVNIEQEDQTIQQPVKV